MIDHSLPDERTTGLQPALDIAQAALACIDIFLAVVEPPDCDASAPQSVRRKSELRLKRQEIAAGSKERAYERAAWVKRIGASGG